MRDSDLFLLVLALAAGVAAGIGVVLIDLALSLLRWLAFGISEEGHLIDIDLGWLSRGQPVPDHGRLPRGSGPGRRGSRGSQPLMVPTPGLTGPTLR